MVCDDPLYACHRGLDSDDSSDADSEDSNAENDWRNDYPDEDEDGLADGASVGEDDMVRAVEDLDLGMMMLNPLRVCVSFAANLAMCNWVFFVLFGRWRTGTILGRRLRAVR